MLASIGAQSIDDLFASPNIQAEGSLRLPGRFLSMKSSNIFERERENSCAIRASWARRLQHLRSVVRTSISAENS